jgi:class 3 adenylate cyclase
VKLAQGDLEAAARYFEADFEIAREIGDARGMGTMQNHLGEVALKSKRPESAAEHFHAALAADPSATNRAFATVGLAFTEVGDLDACRERCRAARELIDDCKTGREGLRAMVSFAEAEALAAAGRREEALELLESAASTFRERSVGPRLLEVLLLASRLYAELGNTEAALDAAREVLGLLDDYGAEKRVREVEQWISRFDRPALLTLLLRRYLPDAYVSTLLGAQSTSATSARRVVSVLFCDIRGFTAFAESTEPEEVTKTLNAWLKVATEAVHQHGGVIDKFLGDGLMAHFGAFPDERGAEAESNHARAALAAGVALLERITALNEERELTGRPALRIGVGVATGEAVVGNVGSEAKMELTAIGRPVNLASRLEAATKDVGWPYVTCGRTCELAGDFVETDVRTDLDLRGIADGLPVHLVRRVGEKEVAG